jgi:hypothetical protein
MGTTSRILKPNPIEKTDAEGITVFTEKPESTPFKPADR